MGHSLQQDRVQAVCKSPGPTERTVSAEFFSTVLVRVSACNAHTETKPLEKLQPAQVCVVFELPASLQSSNCVPRKLVYIEWFTPISAVNPLHGFCTTAPSWRSVEQRQRWASIIPLDDIV
jgi:hypothetical protein